MMDNTDFEVESKDANNTPKASRIVYRNHDDGDS